LKHPRLAYVLLAAGGSRRFGSSKQLASVDFKRSLLECALETALEVAPGELHLVLGAYLDQIKSILQFDEKYPRVDLIINKNWTQGVGSSISCGIRKLMKDQVYDGVLIQLADQVAIRPEQLKAMRDVWYSNPKKIVTAHYNDVLGAPAILPEKYFLNLAELEGDRGARWLIEQEKHNALHFELPEAQWDIDTERQLSDWQYSSL